MDNNFTTLDKLPINSIGKINSINCSENIKRRLLDLGLVTNTKIIPILVSPFGDPIAYSVRGSIISIRKEDSSLIHISF